MKSPRLLLLLLALVAVLAACGGDDGGGSEAGGSDGGGGDAQAFCSKQEELDSLDTADPEEMSAAIDDLVADAPEEISDDIQLIADTLEQLQDASSPEDLEGVDTDELEAASERIESWVEENCEEG
ncbi:MAG TPA: hypothetical protein VG318_13895 [Actinomycetota bacterium]|nr:hypothetical protein [Actinomycetota bacterium]